MTTKTEIVTAMSRAQLALQADMITLMNRAYERCDTASNMELLSDNIMELWIVSQVKAYVNVDGTSRVNTYVAKLSLARMYTGKKHGHSVRGTVKAIPFKFEYISSVGNTSEDNATVWPIAGETEERKNFLAEYAKKLVIAYMRKQEEILNADFEELPRVKSIENTRDADGKLLPAFKKFKDLYAGKKPMTDDQFGEAVTKTVTDTAKKA